MKIFLTAIALFATIAFGVAHTAAARSFGSGGAMRMSPAPTTMRPNTHAPRVNTPSTPRAVTPSAPRQQMVRDNNTGLWMVLVTTYILTQNDRGETIEVPQTERRPATETEIARHETDRRAREDMTTRMGMGVLILAGIFMAFLVISSNAATHRKP